MTLESSQTYDFDSRLVVNLQASCHTQTNTQLKVIWTCLWFWLDIR